MGDKDQEVNDGGHTTTSEVGSQPHSTPFGALDVEEKWRQLLEQQNRNFLALVQAMKMPEKKNEIQLPEFDPEKRYVDARAWIATADMCIGDQTLQGVSLMNILSRSLRGQASSWLSTVAYQGMTWGEFKELFSARFDCPETGAAFLINLQNSRPRDGECLASYAATLITSIMAQWKNISPEHIAVSTVMAHIAQFEPRVQRLAFTSDITTRTRMQQELRALSFLKRKSTITNDVEESDAKKLKPSLVVGPPKCYNCGNFGHKAVQCKFKRDVVEKDTVSSKPATEVTPVNCYSCRGTGHYASNCPSKKTGDAGSGASAERRVDSCIVDAPCGMMR